MACDTAACRTSRAPVASVGYPALGATGTVLHQVVRERLESFLATTRRADPNGLPPFLEQEFLAFLVDHILPHVPVRQWVLSLPHGLRYRLDWDHVLCRAVLAIYTRALLGFDTPPRRTLTPRTLPG
ncbi:MAG: hypothetical protein IT293_11655 [Deltaproteobacteria bacterium]|nr:hypothetical protein [Deltaproteobacteria bacterium]